MPMTRLRRMLTTLQGWIRGWSRALVRLARWAFLEPRLAWAALLAPIAFWSVTWLALPECDQSLRLAGLALQILGLLQVASVSSGAPRRLGEGPGGSSLALASEKPPRLGGGDFLAGNPMVAL